MRTNNPDTLADLSEVYRLLDKNKGQRIVMVDARGAGSFADFFIYCTGSSETHNSFLRDELELKLKGRLTKPYPHNYHKSSSAEWIVLDFGEIIVHIFTEQLRDYYNLEGMWHDCPFLTAEQIGVTP